MNESTAAKPAEFSAFGKLTEIKTGQELIHFLNIGYGRRLGKPMIVSTGDPVVCDDITHVEENEDNLVFYTKQNPKRE